MFLIYLSMSKLNPDGSLNLAEIIVKDIYRARDRHKARLLNLFTIISDLNKSSLGCKLYRNKHTKNGFDIIDRKFHHETEAQNGMRVDIHGTAKDGRSIYICFQKTKRKLSPKKRAFLQEMEKMNCLVGTAYDYSDCFDIIQDTRRKKRTFEYREEK